MASDEPGYIKEEPSYDEQTPSMNAGEDIDREKDPSNIKTEETDRELEDSMHPADKEAFSRHFLSQKNNDSDEEGIRKDDEDEEAFTMPQHFLSVEHNSSMETEESNRGLEDSMHPADKEAFSQHFLSQKDNDSDEEGQDTNPPSPVVDATADPRYTLIHYYDGPGGKRRNMYSCNTCDEDFKEKRVCIRHVRAHIWAGKPFPCDQCEKAFDKRWMLDRHVKTHKPRDFVCNICSKDFYKKIHLIDHMVRAHGAQYQTISGTENSNSGLEEKITDGENTDALHMPKHFLSDNNTGKPLAVEKNPKIIENKESDQLLEGKGHGSENIRKNADDTDTLDKQKPFPRVNVKEMPLAAEAKPSSTETEKSNRGLEDSAENGDKEKYSVPEHFLSQTSNSAENSHPEHFLSQTNNGSDEEGSDVNNVVGASAETLYTLNHIVDGNKKIVRYSCNVCEKGFKDRRVCIRHIRVHTGEKPFKCYLCGRGFGREDYLRRHIESHMGQKLFTCPLCNKDFMRKDSLEDHLLTHQDMSERPFQCDQCDKGFIKRTHLKRHMKTHSLIRDFICTTCGKGFNEKRHLLDHMNRRHSDKEQPTCKICEREFWSEYHYRKHMEAHENEENEAEDQLMSNLPTFVSKEEREMQNQDNSSSSEEEEDESQNNPQNPSSETSNSHSLFGNVLGASKEETESQNNPQNSPSEASNSHSSFGNVHGASKEDRESQNNPQNHPQNLSQNHPQNLSQNHPQNPPSEASNSHSSFGNVHGANHGLGIIDNAKVPQIPHTFSPHPLANFANEANVHGVHYGRGIIDNYKMPPMPHTFSPNPLANFANEGNMHGVNYGRGIIDNYRVPQMPNTVSDNPLANFTNEEFSTHNPHYS